MERLCSRFGRRGGRRLIPLQADYCGNSNVLRRAVVPERGGSGAAGDPRDRGGILPFCAGTKRPVPDYYSDRPPILPLPVLGRLFGAQSNFFDCAPAVWGRGETGVRMEPFG